MGRGVLYVLLCIIAIIVIVILLRAVGVFR